MRECHSAGHMHYPEGADIINMLQPGTTKTFHDYATDVFLSCITSNLQHVTRLDIVWDEYVPESLKADTRSNRRKGVMRHVESSSTLSGNWQAFLCIDKNKTELFSFLAMRAAGIDTTKLVLTTHHVDALCTNQQDVSSLVPCTHAKADTCMLLHLEDAVHQGHSKVSIHTIVTDVVVLAITQPSTSTSVNCGLPLELERTSDFLLLMRLPENLIDVLHVMIDIFFEVELDTWKGYEDVTSAFFALFLHQLYKPLRNDWGNWSNL